jgi:transcriptional regulator with XRE-family HTH domain
MKELLAVLAHNIRALRKAAKKAQEGLAHLAHLSAPTLSRLERGKGSQDLSTLWQIGMALETRVGELFAKPAAQKPSGRDGPRATGRSARCSTLRRSPARLGALRARLPRHAPAHSETR